MTREDKCKLAISKGYIYDSITGKIYGSSGNEITRRHKKGYIFLNIYNKGKIINLLGHQFAYYYKYGEIVDCIDHINGIKDDNRICNLRKVTNQQNQWNTKNSKGYCYRKDRNKFHSQIGYNNNNISLGFFKTEEEARQAYLDAKKIYHKI